MVEDDPGLGPELAAELEGRGYAVEWVRDAQAGAPPDSGASFDAVVLDYFLPRGDGLSLTRAWKSTARPPVVVLVSGADVSGEIARRLAAEHRPDAVFPKPLALAQFLAEVARLVPLPGSARDPDRPRGRTTPLDSRPATLPDVLWRLWRGTRTGVLELPGPESASNVHILNGAPVLVEAGTIDETLGRIMLRAGILRQTEYERVLRKMVEDLQAGEEVRFGEVAVQLGYATAEQVVDTLKTQVREKLVNLFHRDGGPITFREGRDRVLVGSTFRVEPGEIILDGIRRHFGQARLEPLLNRYVGLYAAIAPSFDELRPWLRFTTREQRFLAEIRGERMVRALIEGGHLPRLHAMQVLYTLLVVDGLELSSDPIPPRGELRPSETRIRPPSSSTGDPAREEVLARHLRLSGRSHYDVLGVHPRASQGEIEKAYAALAARFSPDKLLTMGLGDLHEQATEAWARITIAFETLRDPLRRDAYDQTLGPPERRPASRTVRGALFLAEAAFQVGLRELAADRSDAALLELGKAREGCPDEPEYACWEIWAQALFAIAGGADARVTGRDARLRMEAAMLGRRPRPRALYVLALACQLCGDLEEARVHASAALAFDPAFAEARRLAEALAPAPAADVLLG